MRELLEMGEAKQFENWNHTAAVMSILANVNRSKKGRSYTTADFHPMQNKRRGTVINKRSIGVLKSFVGEENFRTIKGN